jgi:hypothetical protein
VCRSCGSSYVIDVTETSPYILTNGYMLDTFTKTAEPTFEPTTYPTLAPTEAPTLFPTTIPTSAPTPTPYPEVKYMAIASRASSSVVATLALSKPGTAFCLATTISGATPPTGAAVKSGYCGSASVTAGYIPFNVTCSGLTPLTR